MFRKIIVLFLSLFFSKLIFAIDLEDVTKQELETIQNSKEIAIKVMLAKGYKDFSLNEMSLKVLDNLISEEGATYSEKTKVTLTQVFGSYLGELIIQDYGGRWGKLGDDYVIKTNSGMVSFPLNKVYKQIENGSGDSIYAFYVTAGLTPNDIEKLENNEVINFKSKAQNPK